MKNGQNRIVAIGLLASTVACWAQAPAPASLLISQDSNVCVVHSGTSKAVIIGKGRFPTVSHDRKWLAYAVEDRATGSSLSVAVAAFPDGTSARTWKVGAPINDLAWSPTSGSLAAITYSGSYAIRVVSVVNGRPLNAKKLVVPSAFGLAWWPDGKSLLFHDLNTLYRMDVNGKIVSRTSTATIVGAPNAVDSLASFVPNPKNPSQIAYIRTVPGTKKFEETFHEPNSALFIWDKATGARKRVTPPDMVAISPVWTRDGKSLVFCGYREAHYKQAYPFRIYSVQPDGSQLSEICKGEDPAL